MLAQRAALRRLVTAGLLLSFCLMTAGNDAAAEAPAPWQGLIEAGKVEFEFYDPERNPQRYPGQTTYFFHVAQQYRFQYEIDRQGAKASLAIRPTMRQVTCRVEHKMLLPKRLDTDHRWNDPLLRHEFDHVAVSTDPRVPLLAEHLLRKICKLTVEIDPRQAVDNQYVDRIVQEEIGRRREAVIELIRANYQRLDDVTRHGTRPIADRESFFKSFYTQAELRKSGFRYLAEATDLLGSRAYAKTPLSYVH